MLGPAIIIMLSTLAALDGAHGRGTWSPTSQKTTDALIAVPRVMRQQGWDAGTGVVALEYRESEGQIGRWSPSTGRRPIPGQGHEGHTGDVVGLQPLFFPHVLPERLVAARRANWHN